MRMNMFGFRLRIKQQRYDYSMRTLTQGTTIINHSLKNEIQKMNYLGERIEHYIKQGDQEQALQSMQSYFEVTEHMLHMVSQMKEKSEDILLKESEVRIIDMIEETLRSLEPLMTSRGISVRTSYRCDIVLGCDQLHIMEVLSNLCMNAIDAMKQGEGMLQIQVYKHKKMAVIEIKDNGKGISDVYQSHIFDPFFTTKKGHGHYGLGLSYCFGVMQMHGGSVWLLDSAIQKGTTIAILFPKRRVISEVKG